MLYVLIYKLIIGTALASQAGSTLGQHWTQHQRSSLLHSPSIRQWRVTDGLKTDLLTEDFSLASHNKLLLTYYTHCAS